MTLPASQFPKVETVKPPLIPHISRQSLMYKYYLLCISQIFLFFLNLFLQLLPGSSIYVTLINKRIFEILLSFIWLPFLSVTHITEEVHEVIFQAHFCL